MKDGIFTQYWDLACSIISDAENNGHEFKEFGSRLQARYAVRSGKETEYKKIDGLSYIERRRISKKLGELSQSYAEHKDQFDLYFRRKDKAA